jgi:Zn-dependent protease with chaperone function
MGLLPLAVLVVALGALATSALLTAARRPVLARVATLEPAQRARWLLALLAAPLVVGLVVLAVALAPCAIAFVLHDLDDCRSHAGLVCRLCLAHATHATEAAWALAALCLLPVATALGRAGSSARRLRRVTAQLRSVARPDGTSGVWWVPGVASFVAGWPRGVVCMGEDLAARLPPAALHAVGAHEAAHLRRRDVHRKILARALAATHLPGVARSLLDALDLAVEQACDAEAALAVRDPLIVADALITVARLEARLARAPVAAFTAGALDARIEALCAPHWRRPGHGALVAGLAAVAAVGLAIAFDHRIHDAADAVLSILD